MERKGSMYLSGQAIMGAAAVLVGVLLLLDNFDVLDARMYLRFWPLVLVVFGAARIFSSSHRGGQFVGVVITFVGAVLLVRALGFTDLEFHDLWPLILVLIGGSMLLGRSPRWTPQSGGQPATDSHSSLNAFAVLGGVQQSYNTQDFRGGEANAIMGGCEIDLRQASIQGDEAVISTFAMWGGIKIKVPTTWNVHVQGVPFLGGFDDKSVTPGDPAAKRLIVKGTAVMGGVEVTN